MNTLDQLITIVGSQSILAKELGVSPQVISNWKRSGKVSRFGAILIERHPLLGMEFAAKDIRPDLFNV